MKTMQFFRARCKELLEATQPRKVWTRELRNQTFGYHLLGTCRMGNDPHNSVVDKYHRAHDVPNLFICDGSSFVTSGRGQPTCTIQALAFRASDHIIRMAKSGDIKSGI
jgi:choline dehydrogenase-like flavoprotein